MVIKTTFARREQLESEKAAKILARFGRVTESNEEYAWAKKMKIAADEGDALERMIAEQRK